MQNIKSQPYDHLFISTNSPIPSRNYKYKPLKREKVEKNSNYFQRPAIFRGERKLQKKKTKMEDFPTELELTAASALLLLSTNFSLPKEESVKDFERNLCGKSVEVEEATISLEKSSDTTPCRSSLTSDYSVSTHRLQLMASAVARYRSMKLKKMVVNDLIFGQQVARRARTKVIYRGYNDQKSAPKSWAKPQAKTPNKASTSQVITEGTTTTTTESSCLSSGGTSEISSGRNRGKAAAAAVVAEQKRRRGTGPTYISRRAEAILRLLSCKGCASEVRIRQLLGDSPDTSKALRMLLRMEEVKRSGAGGRIDPFIYKVIFFNPTPLVNYVGQNTSKLYQH
ncbi:uncharacterized protein LOC110707169 [Chenopodium quinoa]|uniref:uncharacterized protein LOC110707169 n=1 Tax=Chenopodium quinoa TaxID=63459 RepID=UPI000B791046|nr:uncharacterized protein LOC110707169 [Chenopodium quinoa]